MAIKTPHTDILTRLRTITSLQQVAVYNNQPETFENIEVFACPAVFTEWQTQGATLIGEGVTSSDFRLRIHIIHTELDAGDGTMDQNLNVFDVRDAVKRKINRYKPSNCSMLVPVGEEEDASHNNIYHYILDYAGTHIDTVGSKVFVNEVNSDDESLILSSSPTELDLTTTIE